MKGRARILKGQRSDRYWILRPDAHIPGSLVSPRRGPCRVRGMHRWLDAVVVGRDPVRRACGPAEAALEAGGERDGTEP